MAAAGWIILGVTVAVCATVALVTGHLSQDAWLSAVGASGGIGGAGAHRAGVGGKS